MGVPNTKAAWQERAERAEAKLEKLRSHINELKRGAVNKWGKRACKQAIQSDDNLMALVRFAEATDGPTVEAEGEATSD